MPDRDLRQGENAVQAPSFYRDSADAQAKRVEALVAEVYALRERLEAKDRRISDLELRLRGVPFRSA